MFFGSEGDSSVDWVSNINNDNNNITIFPNWALGVICYGNSFMEIPPFNAETPEKVFQNIIRRRIDWHEDEMEVSPDARDLMERLMCSDPEKRLGTREPMKSRIIHSSNPLSWSKIREEQPSFIPQVEAEDDTTYFDGRRCSIAGRFG